jgi:hypothetical protein
MGNAVALNELFEGGDGLVFLPLSVRGIDHRGVQPLPVASTTATLQPVR